MTKNLRLLLAVATASIIALSDLEMAHAGRARPNNKKRDKDHKAAATDTAKRNQNSREAALAASSVLKDGASSVVPGASTLKPIDSDSNAEEEEKLEKIGEDIALLKLDDKIYWNRFLQNSGSAGAAPSAAPSDPLTPIPTVPTNPVSTNPLPTNPLPTNPVPTNPVPTNPVPTNPVSTSSFSFARRTRRQRRVKKRNDSDA